MPRLPCPRTCHSVYRRANKGAEANTISNPRMIYPGLIVLKPKPKTAIPKNAVRNEPMVRSFRRVCCIVAVYTAGYSRDTTTPSFPEKSL